MSEQKKTGPPSLDELYGEEFTSFRFKLTERQLAFLKERAQEQRISVAAYIRNWIDEEIKSHVNIES